MNLQKQKLFDQRSHLENFFKIMPSSLYAGPTPFKRVLQLLPGSLVDPQVVLPGGEVFKIIH